MLCRFNVGCQLSFRSSHAPALIHHLPLPPIPLTTMLYSPSTLAHPFLTPLSYAHSLANQCSLILLLHPSPSFWSETAQLAWLGDGCRFPPLNDSTFALYLLNPLPSLTLLFSNKTLSHQLTLYPNDPTARRGSPGIHNQLTLLPNQCS